MFTAISSPILPLAPTPPGRTEPTQSTTAAPRTSEPVSASNAITPGAVFSVHPPDTTTRATALDNGPLRGSTPEDRARRQAATAEPRHLFAAMVKDETPPTEPPEKVARETPAPLPETTEPVDATPLAASAVDADPGLRDAE